MNACDMIARCGARQRGPMPTDAPGGRANEAPEDVAVLPSPDPIPDSYYPLTLTVDWLDHAPF